MRDEEQPQILLFFLRPSLIELQKLRVIMLLSFILSWLTDLLERTSRQGQHRASFFRRDDHLRDLLEVPSLPTLISIIVYVDLRER